MAENRDERAAGDASRTTPERAPAGEVVEPGPLVAGMVLAGRYEIRGVIGRGGMGVVVRAHDRVLGQPVAIKILRAEYAGERQWAERLAREVRLARQIHHPNVCRVFDFEESDGRVFLVMELAEGGSLRDELASGAVAVRPLAERLADARAIAEGLAAIHAAGIIHRDLSPQNLLRMNDGRLVISDFGLSIDTSESATSMRGGTVAYMAPEVVRGAAPSFAADIWSLGVVLHEAVFGARPRWKDATGFEMLEPEVRRRLSSKEEAVLGTCRACTAVHLDGRIRDVGSVAKMLAGEGPRWRGNRSKTGLLVLGLVALIAGATVARVRRAGQADRSERDQSFIVPSGTPEDWTDKARILAEIGDRIPCLAGLPDHRTIRFVWGTPPRAEDIDTSSGRRSPSPIDSSTYAEGCPDLSPDGHRLLFQGRGPDGRPYAFVSRTPDGRDATAVASIADPSMDSQPLWLPDGHSFVHDIDFRHVGIYSLSTERTTVVPEPLLPAYMSEWHWRSDNMLFLSAHDSTPRTEVTAYALPTMAEQFRIRLSVFALNFYQRDRQSVFCTSATGVLEVDPVRAEARQRGFIRQQFIGHLRPVEQGLAFVSVRVTHTILDKSAGHAVGMDGGDAITATRCGADYLTGEDVSGRNFIVRRDTTGRIAGPLTAGPADRSPSCSADGKVWYYGRGGPPGRIMRCDASGCTHLLDSSFESVVSSPDGGRLAIIESDREGVAIVLVDVATRSKHRLTETETICSPIWSSNRTLWISRERRNAFWWTEVDVDSGQETGRKVPGSTNCSAATEDPVAPSDRNVTVVEARTSQVRLLSWKYLRPE